MSEIYFPMTCNILTPGHIKALEFLNQKGWVVVGLLTEKALKGYKTELQPYEDRKYILDTVAMALGHIEVVPQDSLDPTENIKKHACDAIASGDGWEPAELKAIHKLKLTQINVKLRGEKIKKYSSTQIWKRKKSC
jgi:glycerol-3-phosphate cytidylyltransferase-like family protein